MTVRDMAYGMAVPDGSPYGSADSPWARGGRARTMVAAHNAACLRGGAS